MLKFVVLAFATLICGNLWAYDFPKGPNPETTPGSYCTHPDSYRYPAHIPYCSRAVNTQEKWQVIDLYNSKFGYRIDQSNRGDFKIDHLIPLCAGGSNEITNLWPQHRSIYTITDPVEPLVCQRMAEGKLTQQRAIELVFQAKYHLDQVDQVMQILINL